MAFDSFSLYLTTDSKMVAFGGEEACCDVDGNAASSSTKKIVVVFINGFLSPNNWVSYPEHMIPPHVQMISVYPSPTGSFHDRVCQIFYELKGGTVDYGEEHSNYHGHHRYGKHFPIGKYPQWSAENPIVLIGHSLGGMTAWVFQNYLAEKMFPGHDTDASWIKSLIGVTSPYNGTLKVYETGIRLKQPPIFHWASPGYWISFMVHLGESFDYRPWLDLDERQWMVWLGSPHAALLCVLMLCGYGMHSATDNTAFDTTIHSNLVWNHALNTYPDTYYFSIVGKVNKDVEYEEEDHREEKTDSRTTPYKILKVLMKMLHIPAPQTIAGIVTEHWLHQGTDGVVCTYAQEYPRVANRHEAEEVRRLKGKDDVRPGVWYYSHRNISHICTSFMCEKTWAYILHVLDDLEQRYEEKCQQEKKELQQLDIGKRKQHKAAKVKANSSHLLSQYKPDMQDGELSLADCHDCCSTVSLPWFNAPIVVTARIAVMLLLVVLLLVDLLNDYHDLFAPTTSCPIDLDISSSFSAQSCSSSNGLATVFDKFSLMVPAALTLPVMAWTLFYSSNNKTVERTPILPFLAWETCHACVRISVLGSLLLMLRGSPEHRAMSILFSASGLRWSWLIECLGNAAFGMDKSPVLQPALKVGTGVVTAGLLQCLQASTNTTLNNVVIATLIAQQLMMITPTFIWLCIHIQPVKDRGDMKYSIRMGYKVGAMFFFIIVFIAATICPFIGRSTFSLIGANHDLISTEFDSIAPIKLWLTLQCIWSFIKYSDFAHVVTFILIQVKFMHYRMKEWKASIGTDEHVPMRMLD